MCYRDVSLAICYASVSYVVEGIESGVLIYRVHIFITNRWAIPFSLQGGALRERERDFNISSIMYHTQPFKVFITNKKDFGGPYPSSLLDSPTLPSF